MRSRKFSFFVSFPKIAAWFHHALPKIALDSIWFIKFTRPFSEYFLKWTFQVKLDTLLLTCRIVPLSISNSESKYILSETSENFRFQSCSVFPHNDGLSKQCRGFFQTFWFEFIIHQNSPLFVEITVGYGTKRKVNFCILLRNFDLFNCINNNYYSCFTSNVFINSFIFIFADYIGIR